jgi:hypothetical protein
MATDDDQASTRSAFFPLDPFGTVTTDSVREVPIGQRGGDSKEALAPRADAEHGANAAGRLGQSR